MFPLPISGAAVEVTKAEPYDMCGSERLGSRDGDSQICAESSVVIRGPLCL